MIQLIRAILEGASVCEAAKLASLPDAIVGATFQRFRQAMKGAMIEAGMRYVSNSLASSSPVDIIDQILAELGSYGHDVIDDTQPGWVDRREEIRTGKPREDRKRREHPATQAGNQPQEDLFTGHITPASSPVDMMDGIKQELEWQSADDFDDTAPAYLEKQAAKQKPDSSSRVDPSMGT